MDCGPTCLRIVARFYGKNYSLQSLRDRCHLTREGVSMLGISDAAESIGFRTSGVKVTWEQFRDEMPLPCIAHWNQRHFVVVYEIKKHRGDYKVKVSDPASGLLEYAENDFRKAWLQDKEHGQYGIALILEPIPEFYSAKGDKDSRMSFRYLVEYLRPYRNYFLQLFLAMIVASVISLILPFITQAVVDTGIGTGDLSFIAVLLAAQFLLVLGQLCNSLIRSWLMLHMTTRVSISLISDFLCKLMRLPIAFFDSKMTGDLMQRIGDYNRIQKFLTGSIISMAVALVSFVIYSLIMAGYHPLVFAVFITGSIIYILWVILFLKYRRKLDYMRFQEAAANQSSIVQLIHGMQDIKLNNCEKQKRWEWEEIQARLFKVSIKSLSVAQVQEIGGTFIEQAKNIMISFLSAVAVIQGDMTLGMMMALQYIIGQLNAPISQFISFVQETQDASISLERLGEIHEKNDEDPADVQKIRDIPANADIVFSDVVFQYDGPHSDKVLDKISLCIPSNKVTAIVGVSGSGKTTMLKMMLGFYRPVSGSITLGGLDLDAYSMRSWRSRCGSVMQEGYIFSDTIAGNIGISDTVADMEKVRNAAAVSNIREWIESLPLRYHTRIGADGHGLSTGQKQRLLIARAAYKNAEYLFFDEATNSLDANNEKAIMDNMERLFSGKTVVIVAHRLSTVRNADNIVVLDKGRIAEQGTHDYLVSLKGKYYTLVKNQLELGQ